MTVSPKCHPSLAVRRALSIAALALAGVLCGCDQTASQFAEAQQYLDAALDKVNNAERGFTSSGGQDLQAYRQTVLASAIPDLKRVISTGVPQQQVAASRLHAQIDASAARSDTRKAVTVYAELANELASSVTYLLAVDRATVRAADFDRNLDEIIARYEADSEQDAEQREVLSAEVETLREELEGMVNIIDDLHDQADQAFAESQKLREEAFVATGEQRYELEESAAQAELRANKASTEADKMEAQADAVRARLALVQAQVQLKTQDIADLAVQVEEVQQREQADRESREKALAEREEAAEVLTSKLDQLFDRYEKEVRDPLEAAHEQMDQAVGMLESAVSRAGANQELRGDVNSDLLSAQIAKINILTEHALLAADFAGKLNVFAADADRLLPERAEKITGLIDALTARQAELRTEALVSIEQAKELAGDDQDAIDTIEAYELRLIRSTIE